MKLTAPITSRTKLIRSVSCILASAIVLACSADSFAQTPIAQTPIAQTPIAQTPIAQTPIVNSLNVEVGGVGCSQSVHQRHCCFDRTLPTGDLAQRFPYDTFRMYYYNRPYNPDHVSQQVYNGQRGSAQPQLLYSNQIFLQVFEQTERDLINQQIDTYYPGQTLASPVQQIIRDKNLEYVDWYAHRESRLNWQHAQTETEQQEQKVKNELQPEKRRSNNR